MSWKKTKAIWFIFGFIGILLFIGMEQSGAAPPQATQISFSGSEHLGNPTDEAITINVVPESTVYIYFEYGTTPGVYTDQTTTGLATATEPYEVVISGLDADTEYYYRMRYAQDINDTNYIMRPEHSFHTARPAGVPFQFIITSDSHINIALGTLSQWQTALDMIAVDDPDFLIDLGDTFAMDNGQNGVFSEAGADAVYLYQRDPNILGRASGTVPMFFAMGNHENEEGWNFDDVNPQPIYSMRARKRYFPLPSPLTDPTFYSANTDPVEVDDVTPPNSHIVGDDQYREDYFAWTWGDALFVVFDPFQYTMLNPYGASAGESNDDPASGDRWNWTLGLQQHQWLRDTLANSNAKYKFLLAHHMVGGTQNYVRGGAEPAHMFEWGGCNVGTATDCNVGDGNWGFDTKRPAAEGWIDPVRQMMIDYDVTAFFHGHDHQFVYEIRDGIVYQEVPSPSQGTTSGFGSYNSSPYVQEMSSNSGYLRLSISPDEALVEYVKTTGTNVGSVQYSYIMAPNQVSTDPNITITNTPLTLFSSDPETPSAEQSYTVSGINLTDDIAITPPVDFEVSLTSGSGFGTSLTLPQSGGDVAATNVYVRFNRATEGTSSGDITHTSPGAVQKNVAVSGTAGAVATGNIIVDGAASSGTGDDVATINVAHTTGTGTDRLMLVGVSWNSGTAATSISSVSFTPNGGTAENLTEVISRRYDDNNRYSAIYSLLNPASGQAGTVTVNFSGSVGNGIVAGVANFAGVDQTTPFGPTGGADASSTTPSVTLTGLDGDELVFDSVFYGGADPVPALTVDASQTEQWNDNLANARGAASIEVASGSSATMSWSTGTPSIWVSVAVAINPVPKQDITMATGWNLVALPLNPVTPFTAQSLLDSLNNQSSSGNCTEVSRWLVSGWESFLNNQGFNDFSIDSGQGYFARCITPFNWEVQGNSVQSSVPVSLGVGWNLLAVPYPTTYQAQSLIDGVVTDGGDCSEVSRWFNSGWESYLNGQGFNDYDIENYEGYFMRCNLISTFTP